MRLDRIIQWAGLALALLSSAPAANAAYLFVTLDPVTVKDTHKDQAEAYRIIPVFQTEVREGRHLEPIEGKPIRASGYNVCYAGYFCAFELTAHDLERVNAGEQLRILFQDHGEVPALLSGLKHDNFYRVTDCRPNHRCLVIDDRGYELVGEVLIQDQKKDCIASNSLYRGVLEETLVQLTASMQAAGGRAVPPMMTAGGLASCVMPQDLHLYLGPLASESAIADLHTVAAYSFFLTKRLSRKPLRAHVDEMKAAYLAASDVEVRAAHAGDVHLKNQDDIAVPKGREWNAPLLLPSNHAICSRALEQLADQGERSVGTCQ